MSSVPPPQPSWARLTDLYDDVAKAIVALKVEKGKICGGNVVPACKQTREAVAAMTRAMVDLDAAVCDIEARELILLPEKRKPAANDEDAPEPKRSASFGEPVMAACIR